VKGEGLRASETVSGTSNYLTWDPTEALPLILNDGTNSYLYGPDDLPVEQISGGGSVLYLHHDQQGSTRLLTGESGKVEGSYTYDAYGNQTGHTGTGTTAQGYDGQYTSLDTKLIYLRTRLYDPSTAQFMTRDPLVGETRAPYTYAGDNPVNEVDPFGRESLFDEIGNFLEPLNPVKYYEEEIESYENGCGYLASVEHGLEGAVVGALDVSGAGEEGLAAKGVEDGAGGIVASDGTRITGFTAHGLNRAIGDGASRAGVNPAAILDALKNPIKIVEGIDDLGRPYKVFTGADARVVVNPDTGKVVSTNPLSGAGAQ
jgi:RHS repeat-associated protein